MAKGRIDIPIRLGIGTVSRRGALGWLGGLAWSVGGVRAAAGRPLGPHQGSPRISSRDAGRLAVAPTTDDLTGILPAERRTVWNPGLNAAGGIPHRTTIFATLTPSGGDDTAAIQATLDRCPDEEVVQLAAGTFNISDGGLFLTRSNITLRGAGPGTPGTGEGGTRLVKADRATNPTAAVLYAGNHPGLFATSINLAADAVRGEATVELERDPGLEVGEFVLVDHVTNDDPDVVWNQFHDGPGGGSRRWFVRQDRSLSQILEVTAVEGTTVRFATPFHWTFRTAFDAQLSRYGVDNGGPVRPFVQWSGVEDIAFSGGRGGDYHGNVALSACAHCWVKNVESDDSIGTAVGLYGTYRCEVRDSFIHSSADPNPGGGGYLTGVHFGGADNLIENNVLWNGNKMIVMRGSGGGNVVAYNYMDDGYGSGYKEFQEVGLNAGHYTTPHMELLEGNHAFNADGDSYWGNSIAITLFRNHLTATRRNAGGLGLSDAKNRRAASLNHFQYDYSFLGNVLGEDGMRLLPGQRAFVYETHDLDEVYDPTTGKGVVDVPMWQLGYVGEDPGQPFDPKVAESAIRHGNFDYVTNSVIWDPARSRELPPSLYLTAKPAFFGDEAWPWVTPEDAARRVATLPARARFDAMPRAAAGEATDDEVDRSGVTPGCDGVVEWVAATDGRLDGLTSALGPAGSVAGAAALVTLDPATLRQAADVLRSTAAEQAESKPPTVATEANDALIEILSGLASSLEELADAIEAGDRATIDATVTTLTEMATALENRNEAPAFAALEQVCPYGGRGG